MIYSNYKYALDYVRKIQFRQHIMIAKAHKINRKYVFAFYSIDIITEKSFFQVYGDGVAP